MSDDARARARVLAAVERCRVASDRWDRMPPWDAGLQAALRKRQVAERNLGYPWRDIEALLQEEGVQ